MKNPTMQNLNIGWNSFKAEVLSYLGQCIVESKTLKSLSIANCFSQMVPGQISPVLFCAEFLSRDRHLMQLDISLNRIDYRGALIIEDALMNHKKLTDLDIRDNPLGVLG